MRCAPNPAGIRSAVCAGFALLCLAVAPTATWPAGRVGEAGTEGHSETMVLRVRLNTVEKGDLFVERTPGGDFLVKIQDLQAMGLKDPPGKLVIIEGEPFISLRSMHGASFDFQEKALALNISVDPHLLPTQTFLREGRRTGPVGDAPAGVSGFFNYALHASGASSVATDFGFAGEAGVRVADYLLLSDVTTSTGNNGERRLVRLMTSVTRDDRDQLRRVVIGDFFTPSRDFSTGVNLGGVSVSKLYALNPYFIQFPTKSVGGTVALPSELEVYLDGQRIRVEKLQPGEYQLNDILSFGGARNVQLLLRDSFGRVQQLSYSFYFSDQPLRQGLHEYSYNAGAIRRRYGADSNRYGPAALSMFHRYGVSDAVTLGVRAEATRDLFNAGPLATFVLGNAGIASVAAAASRIAGHQGGSALASYNYQTKSWSVGASVRRDWREYASLGDPPTVTNRKLEGNVSASYYLPQRGTVSLSHSFLSTRNEVVTSVATAARPFNVLALDSSHVTALSYSAPLISGRATFSATVSHIKDKVLSRNEAFFGVIVFFDKDYSVAANYRRDHNSNAESVQFTKNQPIGEGWGFVLSGNRDSQGNGHSTQSRSNIQYNAPLAIVRADLGRTQDPSGRASNDYRVSIAGGAAYVQETVALGRPIVDSFGIVKVGELPGVAVLVNGQPIGNTNGQGRLFVPTLTPHIDNEVSIDPGSVPIEYSIATTRKTVAPFFHSGAVVEFPVSKLQAFSGKLKFDHGGVIGPLEFHEVDITVEGRNQPFQTGRGGEFYLENLKAGTYRATAQIDGQACVSEIVISKSDEMLVELGDVMCRPAP